MLWNVVRTFLLVSSATALLGTSCVRYDVALKSVAVPSCKDPLPEIVSKIKTHDGSLIRQLSFPDTDKCQNLITVFHEGASEPPDEGLIHWDSRECKLTVAKVFNPKGCMRGIADECERSKAAGRNNLNALIEDLKAISPATFAAPATDAGILQAEQYIKNSCLKKNKGPPLDSSLSPWRELKQKKNPLLP